MRYMLLTELHVREHNKIIDGQGGYMADAANNKKFNRTPQTFMPRISLKEAVALANALRDDFAGKDATPIDLAQSLNRSPSSSSWQFLTGAAVAYGLTTGAYNSAQISLTALGEKLTMPTEEGDDAEALLQAALSPEAPKSFYEKYNRNKFPSEIIAKNVLNQLGVPRDRVDEALKIIKDNADFVGIISEVSGNQYVQLRPGIKNTTKDDTSIEDDSQKSEDDQIKSEDVADNRAVDEVLSTKPKPIFIAHGKDKKPLDQLKAILDQFKIPYRVAIDEAHAGRPISEKVRNLMNECGSAIVIFSSSGEPSDVDAGPIANLNVVFELGAASVLYGDKVIIFKEKDLVLPSDFSDLGHISFEPSNLDAKALDLLKELISMGFVQVTPAA
jgi:predicted nucleotide-binding protein